MEKSWNSWKFKFKSTKKVNLKTFKKFHALQCGFCTPGFLITVDELIENEKFQSENDIRKALSGNLCRCTGYENILNCCRIN